jgi:hypothetical protein
LGDSLLRTINTTMERIVVRTAARSMKDPLDLFTLIRFAMIQRTTSIQAMADAKLKPATIELRD